MIELTDQQVQGLENSEAIPPRLVNPRTKETFVLLRVDEYERLREEYDDSPCTSARSLKRWLGTRASTSGGRTWTSTTMPRRSHESGRRDSGAFPAPFRSAGRSGRPLLCSPTHTWGRSAPSSSPRSRGI